MPHDIKKSRAGKRYTAAWASVGALAAVAGVGAVYELGHDGSSPAAHSTVVGLAAQALPGATSSTATAASPGTAAVSTAPAPSGATAVRISGTVQCQSLNVEGVWVQYLYGGGGWAAWVSSAQKPGYATYSYTLPQGGAYALHVGCGGTTSAWAVAEYSSFNSGAVNDFYCYDESSSSRETYCQKTN